MEDTSKLLEEYKRKIEILEEEKLILTDKTLTFDKIKDYLIKAAKEFENF